MSKRVLYNVSSGSLQATNISGGTINASTFTGGSLSLSGNLNVAGTLTTVNITSTNLVNTNVSAGIVVASTLLSATGTSNTIGAIITNSGNVGIGTNSPTTRLDIINTIGSSNLPFMRLGGGGGSGNQVGIILSPFTSRSGASSQITAVDDGNASAHLTFGTAPTGAGTTLVERMRITNEGHVGIGTTSPLTNLHINGPGLQLGIGNTTGFHFQTTQGALFAYSGAWGTGTTRFSCDSRGNFGIGTLSPTQTLEVGGAIKLSVNASPSNDNAGTYIYDQSDIGPTIAGAQFEVRTGGDTSRLRIDSNGHVGINTTSPEAKLHIVETTSTTGNPADFLIDKLGERSAIQLWAYSNSRSSLLIGSNAYFSNAGNLIMRHTGGSAAGWYMIMGSQSDEFRFSRVTATNTDVDYFSMQSSGSTLLSVLPTVDRANNIRIGRLDSPTIRYHDLEFQTSTTQASSYMGIKLHNGTTTTSQTEVMRLRADGHVGIGTTAPQKELHVSGAYSNYTNSTSGYLELNEGFLANSGYVSFYQSNGVRKGYIGYGTTEASFLLQGEGAREIRIATNDTTRMVISSGGNVGIGTTSPLETLHVNGNIFLNTSGNLWITGRNDSDPVRLRIHNTPGASYIDFMGGSLLFRSGIGGGNATRMSLTTSGNLSVTGALSKGSGTFDIDHPILENKRLVHSFIEGPRCDLIYRGKVTLINGTATVNIDADCVKEVNCAMTNGTFTSLCDNPQFFLQNPNSFNRLRGSISGNILTIICEDTSSTDEVYWQVIAERKDTFIKQWDKTNVNGYLITEHNKE